MIDGTDGQTPSVLHVLTDARTGGLVRTFDEVQTVGARAGTTQPAATPQIAGTGNSIYFGTVAIDTTLSGGTYRMVDPSHGNGTTCDMNQGTGACTTFTDADNVWGNGAQSNRQSAGVDAHYGAAKTFDYFKNVHGRNSIFGNGAGVSSRVHYSSGYVNAFWDGAQMTYGDGAGNARPLVSLDVAGHEMGHGITENIIPGGLTYAGESGGLNETASDIWGTMVEFYAANAADPGRTFTVTNTFIGDFAAWAATPNAQAQVGDFNADGRTDVVLAGGAGWNTLPVAFSNGNGSFAVTNTFIGDFAAWAASPGAVVV